MIRRACVRACFLVVSGCDAVMEVFRLAGRFFTALAWGLAGRRNLIGLIRSRWDREEYLTSERVVMNGLFPWEAAFYAGGLRLGSRVGLIGCGAGRDLIGLARQGHTVTGVDLSPAMIEAARRYVAQAGVTATLQCADVAEQEFPGEDYDALIFSNFTYVLIPGAVRRIDMLRRLRAKLAASGALIIFYFNSRPQASTRVVALARWVARLTANSDLPEWGDELSRFREFQHHFTHEEIASEAKAAGCQLREVCPLVGNEGAFAAMLTPLLAVSR